MHYTLHPPDALKLIYQPYGMGKFEIRIWESEGKWYWYAAGKDGVAANQKEAEDLAKRSIRAEL